MSDYLTVPVALGPRSYEILVGPGLLAKAGVHIHPVLRGKQVFVVSDQPVAALYLDGLQKALRADGIESAAVVVDAGEQTKDFAHLESLLDDLLSARIGRDAAVIALGGGVIGDLAGFAASIALRGIDFIQIPTTLLAQVDSSVGGKTGINTSHGKNLVGAFYQPRLVLADTQLLDSLPRRELLAGYAEVVKYGLIDDAAFFAWLETNGAAVLDGDSDSRRQAVATCCAAKARVVSADEREGDRRILLNLGHTFGHALEAEIGYGDKLLHGEAVAIGTILAFTLSVEMGICPPAALARVRAHFEDVGLPTALPDPPDGGWDPDRLIGRMAHDKKVRDGRVHFVLVRDIGGAFQCRDADMAQVRDVLAAAIG